MGESLKQRRRVNDEGLRIVKANYVPAAAVIRMVQALFGIIGRKGCVGGLISQV
jgi:hypothetical protein